MKAIVLADQKWGIGLDGKQPVLLKEDLKRFRSLTLGETIILGRKTLATFPYGQPLEGRRNLILSQDPDFSVEGAEVFRDLPSLLASAPQDAFVVGGESVYRALLPHCDIALVTRVMQEFPADSWFPDLDADPEWILKVSSPPIVDQEQDLNFQYQVYQKRK